VQARYRRVGFGATAAMRASGRYHATAMSPAPERPIVRGEHVWLRALELSDITEHPIEDGDLAHFAGFPRSFSRAEGERFFQKLASQTDDVLQFAICRLGDDDSIGGVGLRHIDRENGSAEVSIFIAEPSQWGKGLGTDAMRAMLDYAFGEMRLERVWLRVFDYNPRAARSYEKAGFVKEVLLRHDRFHRGKHHDTHLMAIVRSGWEADPRKRSWDY
jgi:RimJ/RimL family protein N-acetyltransferase